MSALFQKTEKAVETVWNMRPWKEKSTFPGIIPHAEQNIFTQLSHKTKLRLLAIFMVLLSCGLVLAVGRHASPDFMAIAAALITMCGLVFYDLLSRRIWENAIAGEMERLSGYHDRLVREVARNRSDIAILKEGLGETATLVHEQGQNGTTAHSAEARMIDTIARQLGQLGEEPRSVISTTHDQNVMELELMPPPARKPLPAAHDLHEGETDINKLSDADVLALVRAAIRSDQIDIFEQPIVSLPQRKTRMKEMFARIKAAPGLYLPASRYMELAQKENAVPAIDNLLLLRCLQMLRTEKNNRRDVPYILNITTQTLNDKGFMNDLLTFLAQNRKMATKIIFELPQSDVSNMNNTMLPIIEGLSHLGCRFSMDRVENRKIDIGTLRKMQIRFIKLDASWLLKEGSHREGFSRVFRLKKQLDAAGIDLIIEKIETEASVRELLDFTIDYGQGFLFGKPDISLHGQTYKEAA